MNNHEKPSLRSAVHSEINMMTSPSPNIVGKLFFSNLFLIYLTKQKITHLFKRWKKESMHILYAKKIRFWKCIANVYSLFDNYRIAAKKKVWYNSKYYINGRQTSLVQKWRDPRELMLVCLTRPNIFSWQINRLINTSIYYYQ